MRHFAATFVVAGVGMLVAGCGGSNHAGTNSATTVTSLIPRPVVERELESLLLTPSQINPLMGATEMAVIRKRDAMSDDSATMKPIECLAIDGSAQAPVYANSGFTADVTRRSTTAITSPTTPSKQWCCFRPPNKPMSSSSPRASDGGVPPVHAHPIQDGVDGGADI